MAKICTVPVGVRRMAESADMIAEPTIDGRMKIMARNSRALVGIVKNEQEAKLAIERFVAQNMKDLDGHLPFPAEGTPLSQSPLAPQSQLTPLRRAISQFQFGPGTAIFTPMEKFTQAVERVGKGMANKLVYKPTQAAKGRFNEAMGRTIRPELKALFGGKDKTYQTAIKEFDRQAIKLDVEQRRLMTLYGEAVTKEELTVPGALLEDGLSQGNINAAIRFAELGVADDIPNLIRRNALIDDFLANRQDMIENTLPGMNNAILEGRLPKELQVDVDRLVQSGGVEDSVEAVMKSLGFTADEQEASALLRLFIDQEEFNIPAIYRYATAPEALAGFKNGREQFAKTFGMTQEAIKLAEDRLTILDSAFRGDTSLRSQVLGAQLPIFRQFITAGILPSKQFGNSSRGAVRKWAAILDDLPEGIEVLSRRVLSGHINPHEFNPAVTAFKHVRNMMLRERHGVVDPTTGVRPPSFDEAMREATTVATGIARGKDERVGKILINYLHELEGLPTESFKSLTAMIRTVGRFTNTPIDDRFAERLVNTLNFMSYSASIPFRFALIARNYFQTTLAIPIVGAESWLHGLKVATSFDGKAFLPRIHEEAMERAVKANALKVNVIPLHGGTEAIGGISEGVFGQMRSEFAKIGYNVNELFDLGFTAYRSGDDWGRVVAFEAGRHRVNKALSVYQRSSKGNEALEALKRQAKVKTFDEVVEAEFETLIRADRFADAENLIGARLADKVHFLYGDANHPSGWGGVGGKLLGQFGTFPVQYLNHVVESMSRGTIADRLGFIGTHSAINLGIIMAGDKLFDADLESWAFAPSLQYTGGPYAELMLSAVGAWGGSEAERSLAVRNIQMMLPWWNRPSIFVPGSYFLADIARATAEDNVVQGIARATGLRFLHDEPSGADQFFDNIRAGFGWLNEMLP